MPLSLEGEQSTLGAMMMEPDAIARARNILNDRDFYRQAHSTIFAAILRLADDGTPVDYITTVEELRRRDQLDEINGPGNGPAYLQALIEACPSAANVEAYARAVFEKSLLRAALVASDALKTAAQSGASFESVARALHNCADLASRTTPSQGFNLVPLDELMTRPNPTWLIRGVLMDATNSMLSAPPASFKSFLVLDMALSVASGRHWHGHAVRQGHVLYICAEGATGMKDRVKAWCIARKTELPPAFHFIEDAVQLADSSHLSQLTNSLGDTKPALIVVDTLSLCALGMEENSSRDMNLFMAAVKRLQAATGAHVLLVHHSAKGTNGSRGSSALPAATQTEFHLKREKDTVTVSCPKQKDGEEFRPMTFIKRTIELHSGGTRHSLVFDVEAQSDDVGGDVLSASERRIYDLLVDTFGAEGATATQWKKVAEEEGISDRTFFRALTKLKDSWIEGGEKRGARWRPVTATHCQVTANGSNGSDANTNCHSLPPPFRGGSNGSDANESEKRR
jgi:hypothetical protein